MKGQVYVQYEDGRYLGNGRLVTDITKARIFSSIGPAKQGVSAYRHAPWLPDQPKNPTYYPINLRNRREIMDALSELAAELPEDMIGEDTPFSRLHDLIIQQGEIKNE